MAAIDYSQRSLDEQHAAFVRTKFLAMPIAGTIAWTGIGIAGAVLSLKGAVVQFGQFANGIAQTDNVEIRYAVPKYRPMAIVGGGFRYAMSRRFTARVEARAALTRDRIMITVDANPTTRSTLATGSAFVTIFSLSPPVSLDFSSSPAGNNSLAGPALNDVVTFSGRGMQTRVSVSAGLGWRF